MSCIFAPMKVMDDDGEQPGGCLFRQTTTRNEITFDCVLIMIAIDDCVVPICPMLVSLYLYIYLC